MVAHGGSSAGSYLADRTSPIPSHCESIVVTSTVRVKNDILDLDFAGTDITNAEEVAIKLECVKTKHPQLHIESKIYKMMQGGGEHLSLSVLAWTQLLGLPMSTVSTQKPTCSLLSLDRT